MTDQEMMEDAASRGVMTFPELVVALDDTKLLQHAMDEGHELSWVLDRLVELTKAGFAIADAARELVGFVSDDGYLLTMQGVRVSRIIRVR